MTLRLDVELDPEQAKALRGTDPKWWFTHVAFANAESPQHPQYRKLEANNEFKRGLVLDWIARTAPGKRVLDTFCANGAFSFEAARLGASRVMGMDFDPPRIEAGNFVSDLLRDHGWPVVPEFRSGDVYQLPSVVGNDAFDVTIMAGGLYHVADPVLVLRRAREVTETGGHLVFQTSRLMWLPGRWARFMVRPSDRREAGFSSFLPGEGVWQLTPGAVEAMLGVAGFRVLEARRPPVARRRRFRWLAALCEAV
jgi:2-polyprenyl-3-methyl-5-hydroxy-6-metoxy-1,4-benzoquinol methylase